jgi:ribosomal protein L44E
MELDGTHEMEMAKRWRSNALTWKRRKRKTKPYGDQDKGINRDFVLPINRVCD